MVTFSSALVGLMVPPAGVIFICLAGIAVGLRRSRLGRRLTVGGVCALFILAMPISGTTMFILLEHGLPLRPSAANPPQAIIILSGDEGHGDETRPGVLSVGPLSLERLRAGAALHRRTDLPVLVSGGPLHPSDEPLASILARSLSDDFGIRARWLEPNSHDTWENAEQSAALLKTENIRSAYVVTQGWHLRRALMAFAHAGLEVTAAPVRLEQPERWDWSDFIPTTAGWMWSYYGLHEWIGCAYYALR